MNICKIISIFLLLIYSTQFSYAEGSVKIIPRSEWGANEEFRYWNSTYWAEIFKKRSAASLASSQKWATYSQEKKDQLTKASQIRKAKTQKMNNYLTNNFYTDIKVVDYQRFENDIKLAWAHSKTEYVKNIVIHHTASQYDSSAEGIKNIYKFHALSRQWGDIGYHYIVGYDGEVYEGKAGGDYIIASHDSWNNRSTVGISLMGNYDVDTINEQQYESLRILVYYLAKKYGIDLNSKIPYHHECFGENCTQPLETDYFYPIVGHRDGKSTTCPGDTVYTDIIPKLLKETQVLTQGFTPISYSTAQEQEATFTQKINAYPWKAIKAKFLKIPEAQRDILLQQITTLSQHTIDWEKKHIYKRFLEEIDR